MSQVTKKAGCDAITHFLGEPNAVANGLAQRGRRAMIRPRTLRINGTQAKGYYREDMIETVQRYVPKSDARALIDELKPAAEEKPGEPGPAEGA